MRKQFINQLNKHRELLGVPIPDVRISLYLRLREIFGISLRNQLLKSTVDTIKKRRWP